MKSGGKTVPPAKLFFIFCDIIYRTIMKDTQMKKVIIFAIILIALMTSACGKSSDNAVSAPQDQLQITGSSENMLTENDSFEPIPVEEPEPEDKYESFDEFIDNFYAAKSNYYAHDWELRMFTNLPQNEPYDFVVRTNDMLITEQSKEEHIQLAQKFAELGCTVKVKEMHEESAGVDQIGWITVVTVAPAELWRIGDYLEQRIFLEQLYPQVDKRYSTVVWTNNEGK